MGYFATYERGTITLSKKKQISNTSEFECCMFFVKESQNIYQGCMDFHKIYFHHKVMEVEEFWALSSSSIKIITIFIDKDNLKNINIIIDKDNLEDIDKESLRSPY